MLELGLIAFGEPLVLIALLVLPAVWWLLRVTPPAPRRIAFPPIRLLFGLRQDEETASRIPLWLLLLRLALVTLLILALADPIWRPAEGTARSNPLLIVMDNGWAAAPDWDTRRAQAEALIDGAARAGELVAVAATAPEARPGPIRFLPAGEALSRLRALTPAPLTPARGALAARLAQMERPEGALDAVWIADGLNHGSAATFAEALQDLSKGGSVRVLTNLPVTIPPVLTPPEPGRSGLELTIYHPEVMETRDGHIEARGEDGRLIGQAEWQLPRAATATKVTLDLPLDLRNAVHRIEVTGARSAASTVLLDERWRRRAVGLVSGAPFEADQPLLSDLYYLERALAPFAEIRKPGAAGRAEDGVSQIESLLTNPLSILFLADIGSLSGSDTQRIREWVEDGGTLVRFAGPRLTAQEADDLLPVALRQGGRTLDGALSWTEPQRLAPFEETSPFAGIELPGDVTVSRQVLADPRDLSFVQTWARLEDGTPLVTAAERGEGRIVLFHVTANTDWSNLPLSGLFVSMLQRVLDLAQGVATQNAASDGGLLTPRRVLDGFGTLGAPSPQVKPISLADWTNAVPSPEHPPGFYGKEGAARALNLGSEKLDLTLLPALGGVEMKTGFGEAVHRSLKPALLVAALLLLLADGLAALYLTGRLTSSGDRTKTAAVALAGLMALPLLLTGGPASAADDSFALRAARETHLAYVKTGDNETDRISHAGLRGLTRKLQERTALEPGDPMGVDVESDELAFFPLLYWPVTENAQPLSDATAAKVSAYMQNGGMVLFDTRDQISADFSGGGNEPLRRVLGKLDVPPLEPVPGDHVLTKSFYLLQSFPGRWQGGQLWVQAPQRGRVQTNDGVSAILIGSNDFAGAWAADESGRALLPVTPGGERQREFAYRFGVNLVMYALTGNYKADQVHVPALLERLGQ